MKYKLLPTSVTLAVVNPTIAVANTVALTLAEILPLASIIILFPANVGNNAITLE